jgi:hypothetical protein
MKITGKLPTPIPAREPISPQGKRKVSGKVFDLLAESEKLKANPVVKNSGTDSSQSALLSQLSVVQNNPQLAQFLENPTLAKYFFDNLYTRLK